MVDSIRERTKSERLLATAADGLELRSDSVRLLALGKVAVSQARALTALLVGRGVEVRSSIAVTKLEEADGFRGEYLVGDHPIPGAHSMRAGLRLVAHASSPDREPADRIVCVSGGGSSLACIPALGLASDYAEMHVLLHRSELPIEIINEVRAAISALKNGGLAEMCREHRLHTLATIDVPSRDPTRVASGPTFTRTLDRRLVESVLHDLLPGDAWRRVTPSLRAEARRLHPDHRVQVVADDRILLEAARVTCAKYGIERIVDANPQRTATSASFAERQSDIEQLLHKELQGDDPVAILWSGELTAAIGPTAGTGGRCSTFVVQLAQLLFRGDRADRDRLLILALASDGDDGSTGTSGAYLDAESHDRARASEGESALHEALQAQDCGALLQRLETTVPGRAFDTNLMDLYTVIRLPIHGN